MQLHNNMYNASKRVRAAELQFFSNPQRMHERGLQQLVCVCVCVCLSGLNLLL